MQIHTIPIGELKPAEYNPRKMNADQAASLRESLTEFGFAEPIIINSFKGRENIIVGGHQRYFVAKEMGIKEIPCVKVSLNLERERELNLRLNKNLGEWDFDMLANFDEQALLNVGFTPDELTVGFGLEFAGQAELDESRFEVITVEPPEAPRLKARHTFYCKTIEEFDRIKKFFHTTKDGELDKNKLLKLLDL